MDSRTDEKLIGDYLAGDEESLRVLIKKNTPRIYNFIAQLIGRGQNAEDATQETFIKAWKNLKKFDQNKKFKTWLFRIARNTAIDFARKRQILSLNLDVIIDEDREDATDSLADETPLPFEQIATQEQAKVIQEAVAKLPEIYKTVINLYYQEELSLAEIAETLDEPLDTIKSRHRRALIKLKQLLTAAP